MASQLMAIDNNFPTFTGEETPEQQIRALHNYLFQLREGLQYSLRNLTAENFNATALQNLTDAQKNEVTAQMEKVYAQLSQMAAQLNSLSGRVSGTENLAGRVTTAEEAISSLKSQVEQAEENIESLAGRVKGLEDDQTLAELQEAVTGEGGLQEQMESTGEGVRKLSGAVQVADDGSTTIGTEGNALYLVGQVYINGVLIGQGGTT